MDNYIVGSLHFSEDGSLNVDQLSLTYYGEFFRIIQDSPLEISKDGEEENHSEDNHEDKDSNTENLKRNASSEDTSEKHFHNQSTQTEKFEEEEDTMKSIQILSTTDVDSDVGEEYHDCGISFEDDDDNDILDKNVASLSEECTTCDVQPPKINTTNVSSLNEECTRSDVQPPELNTKEDSCTTMQQPDVNDGFTMVKRKPRAQKFQTDAPKEIQIKEIVAPNPFALLEEPDKPKSRRSRKKKK